MPIFLSQNRIQTLALVGLILVSAGAHAYDPSLLQGLKWRNIGPFRGGRVSAVAGVVGDAGTYYMGLPQGGIFKTTSAGQTWYPVFDDVTATSSVGSIAVAPSNPKVVYAGTGELSGNYPGNGLYKSEDEGKTWQHLGFESSQIVPAVLVDPKNADIVLFAATGDRSIKTNERGVFRSTDGGKTWDHSLAIDDETGVMSMTSCFDHPEVVLAASRRFYAGKIRGSSQSRSSLYKSSDEGKTWKKLEPKGLPNLAGRYTLAIAQGTNAKEMFVVGNFGLYRSDDGGDNWTKAAVGDRRIANGQGDYSSGVYVNSTDPNTVYTVATCVYRSTDGGKTFEGFKGAPGGDDPHDMWIDPTNGSHMILGGDQGATVSLDGGKTWGLWYNQPTAQVYHVDTSNEFPYWVYATQQDSGVVGTASRGNLGAITNLDWTPHPGFEFGYVTVDPLNPKVTYALGSSIGLAKFTFPSMQWVDAAPSPQVLGELRAGVNIPMIFSHANPHEMIAGYQCLASSIDGGLHWKAISPDLARKPGAKSGGFGAVSCMSESWVDPNVLWAATNSGVIQVTRDRGTHWADASLSVPSGVSSLEASHFQKETAYASARSSFGPCIFRTTDFGHTWTRLGTGFAAKGENSVVVVREDPKKQGLLFAATERQVYFSVDSGDHWQSLRLNLPTTQMSDLKIHGDDLVLGTYGRGIWILDSFNPLREMTTGAGSEDFHLYVPGNGVRVRRNTNGDTPFPPEVPHAPNPPSGVCIYYSLREKPQGPVDIEIVDESGAIVRHLSSVTPKPFNDPTPEVATYWMGKPQVLSTDIGLNRANWDIRYDDHKAFVHDGQDVMAANPGETPQAVPGPLALPGRYTARLRVDGKVLEAKFDVVNDPRSPATSSDLRAQHQLEMQMRDCIEAGMKSADEIDELRRRLSGAKLSQNKAVQDAAKALDSSLAGLHGTVTYSRTLGFGSGSSASNFVALNLMLVSMADNMGTGDSAPTDANWSAYASAYAQTVKLLNRFRDLNSKELAKLNKVLQDGRVATLQPGQVPHDPATPPARYMPKVKGAMPATRGNIDPEEIEHGRDSGEGGDSNYGLN